MTEGWTLPSTFKRLLTAGVSAESTVWQHLISFSLHWELATARTAREATKAILENILYGGILVEDWSTGFSRWWRELCTGWWTCRSLWQGFYTLFSGLCAFFPALTRVWIPLCRTGSVGKCWAIVRIQCGDMASEFQRPGRPLRAEFFVQRKCEKAKKCTRPADCT